LKVCHMGRNCLLSMQLHSESIVVYIFSPSL
jgi:hypothetical protein